MIEASILLSLSKDHTIEVHNVTPLQAMFFCAEHHKNVGGCPVKVIPDTEKEIKVDVQSTERVKTGTQKVKVDKPNPNKSAGQPPVIQVEEDADVYEDKVIIVKGTRSDNDEILRLRAKYGDKKITALLNAFKDLPKTFDEATKMGVQVGMPTSALMQLKAF